MGRQRIPCAARSSSTWSFSASSPSTVEKTTSPPAARRCLATTAAPPVKSCLDSNRTLMVGVFATPPIMLHWV